MADGGDPETTTEPDELDRIHWLSDEELSWIELDAIELGYD